MGGNSCSDQRGTQNSKEDNTKTHNNENGKDQGQGHSFKGSYREEKGHLQGKPIRLSSDFSVETLQARREWHDIFNAIKQKGLEPRILYPARLSCKYGGSKQFPDKQKLREFTSQNHLYRVL